MTRVWALGAIIVMIGIVVGVWFLGVSPRLSEIDNTNDTRESVEAQNSIHEITLARLKADEERKDELLAQMEVASAAFPSELQQTRYLRELNDAAANHGVALTSLQFSDPALFTRPSTEPRTPEIDAALASVSDQNLVVIPLRIEISGSHAAGLSYVNWLQTSSRYFLVSGVEASDGVVGDEPVPLVVSGTLFVLLDPTAVDGGVPDSATPTEVAAGAAG